MNNHLPHIMRMALMPYTPPDRVPAIDTMRTAHQSEPRVPAIVLAASTMDAAIDDLPLSGRVECKPFSVIEQEAQEDARNIVAGMSEAELLQGDRIRQAQKDGDPFGRREANIASRREQDIADVIGRRAS